MTDIVLTIPIEGPQGAKGDAGDRLNVRLATTTQITLSGLQTVDGGALVDGDPILVKNQLAGAQNGVYLASAGAWARDPRAASWTLLVGALVVVSEGTVNALSVWLSGAQAGDTLETTPLSFTNLTALALAPLLALPITLPSSAGQLWWNGGVLSKS